jgi:streptogramin lyase
MSRRFADLSRIGAIVVATGCLAQIGLALTLGASSASATTSLGKIEELTRPAGSVTEDIAAGPEGDLWFTSASPAAIDQLATSGQVLHEFSAGLAAGDKPQAITTGPEGDLWFTESPTEPGKGGAPAVGRITTSGEITEYKAGMIAEDALEGIARGPEGDLWFTESPTEYGKRGSAAIGRIAPSGAVTQFATGLEVGSGPGAIAVGPEDNLWFTDHGADAIGRITTGGSVKEFSLSPPYMSPSAIAAGPDGDLWFTATGENAGEEFESEVARITPSGTVTVEDRPEGPPLGIATGPDGNMWFTALGSEPDRPSMLVGIAPGDMLLGPYKTGLHTESEPGAITAASDGDMWFADNGLTRAIGRLGLGVAAASQAAPVVKGAGQVGNQLLCEGASWSTWAGQQPAASAFAFDGYQWLLDGRTLLGQTAQAYTPTAAEIGHQLSCRVTVTYPLLGVTAAASSAAVTVSPAPVPTPTPTPTPAPAPPPPTPTPPPSVEATMTWTFGWTRHYTLVEALIAHGVPKGGYVEVACNGAGCPFHHHRSATVATASSRTAKHCHKHGKCHTKPPPPQGPNVSLASLFKGKHLHVGASISVSIVKAGWIGKSFVFTMRSNRTPGVQIACLAPGSTSHPGSDC